MALYKPTTNFGDVSLCGAIEAALSKIGLLAVLIDTRDVQSENLRKIKIEAISMANWSMPDENGYVYPDEATNGN